MKANVKAIAGLVRKAKKKLYQGKRDEALELMKRAVALDDNSGVLVQVIKVIGRKKPRTEYHEDESGEAGDGQYPDSGGSPPAADQPPSDEGEERKPQMSQEDRIQQFFEASDREYEAGHQQKALAYLKRAARLFPDDPGVRERIDLLRTRIKAENLVSIAMKNLQAGEAVKALVLAREVFETMPDARGLDELLDSLEQGPPARPSSPPAEPAPAPAKEENDPAEEYIARVRSLVQANSLLEAASVAEEAYGRHSDNSLLKEFVDNFRKLGLLE